MYDNLKDIRQDIFDIETVPKVFYVYRGDTFELDLDLNITSSELNAVVLNCDGLPEATPLTLLESTDISSKWRLLLNKSQTLILAPKNHNFTITIVRTDGTELTLYKGIMTVNNRIYSNYSNNYYIAALLKQTAPTIADNDYLIGTTWVNVLTNRVYFLTSVVNDEANWLDYSDQLDTLRNDVTQLDERVSTVENDLTLINERVDTHIEDLDNPHRVTAEQINTYVKTIIDNKDANTLQEAKDYTYSKVEIDDKDTAIMNKTNNLENANMFKDVNYNNINGVLTFTKYDGTTKEIDLPLELLVESGYYDDVANELVLVLANSSEIRISVENLLTDLVADNISFDGSGTNYLAGETDVEGAIKELDARVKTNADMAYFNYAGRIYGDKYSLLVSAWEHSLTVDPLEISEHSSEEFPRGRAQYPNGETEGVIIPQGVTRIGNHAFRGWTSNNQPLVIPNSVTRIGNHAFRDWYSNTHLLVIPNSVTSIGNDAFRNWSSNNQPLVIPSSVESIGEGAFQRWQSNSHPLVIPNSVTSIGYGAFYNWQSNNHPLVIPSSVESIGDYVFDGWQSNNHPLVIPDSVTSIGNDAFRNWSSNNQPLVIPNSVESIGLRAFYGWSKVPYIEMQGITPPTLAAETAFSGQNDAPIYVPDESVEAYKTATNWVDLAHRIFGISEKE